MWPNQNYFWLRNWTCWSKHRLLTNGKKRNTCFNLLLMNVNIADFDWTPCWPRLCRRKARESQSLPVKFVSLQYAASLYLVQHRDRQPKPNQDMFQTLTNSSTEHCVQCSCNQCKEKEEWRDRPFFGLSWTQDKSVSYMVLWMQMFEPDIRFELWIFFLCNLGSCP